MKFNPKTSRVLELYQLFRSGAAINKQEFADRYGVNPRSVQRDIDTIRDFLANQTRSQGVIQSIDYDKATNTYSQITNPGAYVDDNGYLHFSTALGGGIIISEGALVTK